jgi:hypothetical protein
VRISRIGMVRALLSIVVLGSPLGAQQMVPRAPVSAEGSAASALLGGAEPGSQLDITLITFGLGEQVFERFGHNAIWVHDRILGTDAAYDWGRFDFAQPHFLECARGEQVLPLRLLPRQLLHAVARCAGPGARRRDPRID